MRRTQLYLDEDLWKALHARARRDKTTISNLVRTAARERYVPTKYTEEQRRADMMAAIGIWKDRTDLPDTETYIRNLRDDDRLERLYGK
jgi:hypothetical protein